VAQLQAQLADARAEVKKWEGTMLQPEDLEAIRNGNPAHDQALAKLSERVEQYMRLYRRAQGRLTDMSDKQHVRSV
jgi:hypothetical protein